ncbi:MAG: hypothetical protein ACLFRR_00385 [Spirochaetaceae bacterium]
MTKMSGCLAGLFLIAAFPAGPSMAVVGADSSEELPREPAEDQYFDVERYDEDEWMTDDRNDDGNTDYAVRVNDDLEKEREAVDYNHDGLMDDFYFYENEVLVRQEIDSDHSGAIDLWIFVRDGAYIERYEQDTTGDGYPDVIEDYGRE